MNTYVRPLNGGLVTRARVLPPPLQAEVSVVMVVYRTGEALEHSIAKVLAEPLVDEFILIDNGSTRQEEALQDAAAADRRMRVLRGHGNVGFARGCNMGGEAAHGRVLVVLNPDAFLQPGCIAALVDALDATPAPRLVGARILNLDGAEQRGARRGEVTPVTALLSLTRLSHAARGLERFEIHHEHDPEPGQLLAVPTISGACFAMTHEDFSALGGFDEGYFLHVEDVDLCWRMRRSGGSVLFAPSARVVHVGSTSHTSPLKVEFFKGLGLVRYFRKRADNPRRLMLAYALSPFIMLVSVLRPLLRYRRTR